MSHGVFKIELRSSEEFFRVRAHGGLDFFEGLRSFQDSGGLCLLLQFCEIAREISMLGFRATTDATKANKHVPQPPDPDVLMRQMDRSIAAVEYQRASTQLSKYPPPQPKSSDNGKTMRAKDESVMLAKGS